MRWRTSESCLFAAAPSNPRIYNALAPATVFVTIMSESLFANFAKRLDKLLDFANGQPDDSNGSVPTNVDKVMDAYFKITIGKRAEDGMLPQLLHSHPRTRDPKANPSQKPWVVSHGCRREDSFDSGLVDSSFATPSAAEPNGRACETVLAVSTSILWDRRLVSEMARELTAKAAVRSDEIDHPLNAFHILFLLLLDTTVDQLADAASSQLFSRKFLKDAESVDNSAWLELN